MKEELLKEHETVVIGLTGGIGSGKSSVANLFEKAGLKVLKADDVAKNIMASDAELQKLLKAEFGDDVFKNDILQADFLATKVFGETAEHRKNLKKLNSLVHPRVLDELLKQINALAESGEKLIVVEIALLYEIELEDAFDYVITVDAPEDIRIKRTMERSRITEAEVRHRIAEQIPAEDKKAWADFVIDNSKDFKTLENSVEFVLSFLPFLKPKRDDEEEDGEE
ncbi:MAG: dephospho-CoA kinase [Bacteroidota bacterium]